MNATTVVNELIKEGKLSGQIPSSTLSRLVQSARLGKKQRRRIISEEKNLKFDFFYPLECIQAERIHDCGNSSLLYTKGALALIHQASAGIFRGIGLIAQAALHKAFLSKAGQVEAEHVKAVIER